MHERIQGLAGTTDKTLTYTVFIGARRFANSKQAILWAWGWRNDLGARLAEGRAEGAI